ncbi:hypothetical protein [Flammeovirga sp. SJP92]|uniref:hypothetical protein n=1 Tax=Flammeovirga sp. SJP92 TaxID=1775430 RepID=UPI000787244A|nr:hypothetical protein [Flammeovirga sp. SJP92]KXX70808.1 hypothetical protein AVL50_11535 [Flammeovirga sp. SJP92]
MTQITTKISNTLSTLGLGSKVTLQESMNLFVGNAYTSNAGNTYFNGLRFTPDIVIKESIGQGHTHTFLNGLKIYAPDGTLISEENYHCFYYSKDNIRHQAKNILLDALMDTAKRKGIQLLKEQVKKQVGKVIDMAIDRPQTEMLEQFAQKQKRLG